MKKPISDYCPVCKSETVKEVLIDYRPISKQPIVYLRCAKCGAKRYVKLERKRYVVGRR